MKERVMMAIRPFQNESESVGIGGMTVENRTDRVQIYGQLQLTRDKKGLGQARELKNILDTVVKALEAERDLPDQVVLTNKPRPAKNPFA
jgi:hypothetical protein